MVFLLDTADLSAIQTYQEIFPVVGVTTNPTILKKEGRIDFFNHFRQIRQVIGNERSLHIQIVSVDKDTMLEEAYQILEKVDRQVYIKVPVTEAGLWVISKLKKEGINVTATAIYSELQAYLAISAGVDYIAPYYNRMENLGLDAGEIVKAMSNFIQQTGSNSKILGASYKNISQVTRTIKSGGHTVTVAPELLSVGVSNAPILQAVSDFKSDWESIYGESKNLMS